MPARHAGGARYNRSVMCWLVGAAGSPGVCLPQLARAARRMVFFDGMMTAQLPPAPMLMKVSRGASGQVMELGWRRPLALNHQLQP